MILKPDNNNHWYRTDGTPAHDANLRDARKESLLPSVTSILKAWPKDTLGRWQIEQAICAAYANPPGKDEPLDAYIPRVFEYSLKPMKDAAEFGRNVHDLISNSHLAREFRGQGESPAVAAARLYWDWAQENVGEIFFSEQVLVNKEWCYAGTADLKCILKDGRTAILDFKTQRVKEGKKPNFYETWAMQLAAYRKCSPADVLVSVVINSDRPEKPYVKYWTDEEAEEGWGMFIACYDVWRRVKNYYPTIRKEAA